MMGARTRPRSAADTNELEALKWPVIEALT